MSKISMVAESTFKNSIDEEISALEEIAVGLGYNPWLTIQKRCATALLLTTTRLATNLQ